MYVCMYVFVVWWPADYISIVSNLFTNQEVLTKIFAIIHMNFLLLYLLTFFPSSLTSWPAHNTQHYKRWDRVLIWPHLCIRWRDLWLPNTRCILRQHHPSPSSNSQLRGDAHPAVLRPQLCSRWLCGGVLRNRFVLVVWIVVSVHVCCINQVEVRRRVRRQRKILTVLLLVSHRFIGKWSQKNRNWFIKFFIPRLYKTESINSSHYS